MKTNKLGKWQVSPRRISTNVQVVSLSRRGRPSKLSRLTHWAQRVQWEKVLQMIVCINVKVHGSSVRVAFLVFFCISEIVLG